MLAGPSDRDVKLPVNILSSVYSGRDQITKGIEPLARWCVPKARAWVACSRYSVSMRSVGSRFMLTEYREHATPDRETQPRESLGGNRFVQDGPILSTSSRRRVGRA